MRRWMLVVCMVMAVLATAEAVSRRALIFGLGKQEDASWGRIHGDNDVYYVRQMLLQMGYTDIRTLVNEQATKAAMVKAFSKLADDCKSGDVVYIHFSGHGQLMTDLDGDEALKHEQGRHRKWDEAWIPYDAYMVYGPKDRGEKHLSDDEVARLLTLIRERIGRRGEITVVVDACHSGDATCGPEDEAVRGVDTKFCIPLKGNAMQGQPLEERWRTISACQPYQLCTEMKDLHVGKLTFALYQMGGRALSYSNRELERKLADFMQKHRGRLPQTPMVEGRKKH